MSQRRDTDREQNIGQVAQRIYHYDEAVGAYDPSLDLAAWAAEVNRTTGWSFEVNYTSHEYRDPLNEWTRVQGCVLDEADLAQAVSLAQTWMAEALAAFRR